MNDLAARIAEIASDLSTGASPFPSELDDAFAEIATQFRGMEPEQRDDVRRSIDAALSPFLLRLSERCVDWALQTRDARHLLDALTAHAIEDFRSDPRENHLRLVLLYWASNHLDADEALWRDHVGIFSHAGAHHLQRFLTAPKYTRELRAVGLEAVEEAGKIEFVVRPTGWQARRR